MLFSPENSWQWKSIDDSIILPAKPDKGHKELTSKYDLCVTGQALDYLQTMDTRFLHQILPFVKVYARVAPKQKVRSEGVPSLNLLFIIYLVSFVE